MGIPCLRTLILLFMEYLPFLIWFFLSWFIVSQLKSSASILISRETSVVLQMPCFWASQASEGGIEKQMCCGNLVLLAATTCDGAASYRVVWWSESVKEATQTPKTEGRREDHLDQCLSIGGVGWGRCMNLASNPWPPRSIHWWIVWKAWNF